jgi:hypothetical protein
MRLGSGSLAGLAILLAAAALIHMRGIVLWISVFGKDLSKKLEALLRGEGPASAIARIAEAGEAEEHHGPG